MAMMDIAQKGIKCTFMNLKLTSDKLLKYVWEHSFYKLMHKTRKHLKKILYYYSSSYEINEQICQRNTKQCQVSTVLSGCKAFSLNSISCVKRLVVYLCN